MSMATSNFVVKKILIELFILFTTYRSHEIRLKSYAQSISLLFPDFCQSVNNLYRDKTTRRSMGRSL